MRLLRLPIVLVGSAIGAAACSETPFSPTPSVGTPSGPPPVITPALLQWPTSGLVGGGTGGLWVASQERPFEWRLPTMDDSDVLSYPAWSPDGNRVAFSSGGWKTSYSEWAIQVLSKDGTRVRLSPAGAYDIGASWSPDGKRIAFLSNEGGWSDIYVMDADGANRARITNSVNIQEPWFPAWSPDGNRIAYAMSDWTRAPGERPNIGIYVINPDGTDLLRLTPDSIHAAEVQRPTWSPDGRRLAFLTIDQRTIGVIDADGTNLEYLSFDMRAGELAWSPDGEFIVFDTVVSCEFDCEAIPGPTIWMIYLRDATLIDTGMSLYDPAWVR
jgi:Tol biopolymer transport system component